MAIATNNRQTAYKVAMTRYVPRGAQRAATYRRRAKHAQRTLLPPRGSDPIGNPSVEVLRELIDEQTSRKKEKPWR